MKLTLLRLNLLTHLLKKIENLTIMLDVFLECLAIDQDIVSVCYAENIEV
jgi:hypothetical protein